VYVYFGGATLDATPEVTMTGPATEAFGFALTGGGDIDGDGFADVLVGSPPNQPAVNGGHIYLYRGGVNMDGVADFVQSGGTSERCGSAVVSMGDTDGDGFWDFAYPAVDASGQGLSLGGLYLVSNNPRLLPNIGVTNISLGGTPAAAPGDLNGDGLADLVMPLDGHGAQVFFSGTDTYGVPDLRLGTDPGTGTVFLTMGDIDRDGFADVLIGYTSPNERVEVYRGGAFMDAQVDTTLVTDMAGDSFGIAISVPGDINGDGFWDIAVGADYHQGIAYATGRIDVFFGGVPLDTTIDLRFNGVQAEDSLGLTLASLRPASLGVRGRQAGLSWRTWAFGPRRR
jgi:hypothetical protein